MATWYVWSGATGAADGTSWTDAEVSLSDLFSGAAISSGDTILIAHDHDNGSYASSKTFNFPESGAATASHVYLISTNRTSGLPSAGAIERTNGNFFLKFSYRLYAYGVTFSVGSGGSETTATITIGGTTGIGTYGKMYFDKCNFVLNTTGSPAGGIFKVDSANWNMHVVFNQCDFDFGATSQSIHIGGCFAEFVECTLSGGTYPTELFSDIADGLPMLFMVGCDFSLASNLFSTSIDRAWTVRGNNCKIPSNLFSSSPGANYQNFDIELHACGTGDNNYYFNRFTREGEITQDVGVYLTTGGYTAKNHDGSQVNSSLKMVTDALARNCNVINACYTPWLYNFVQSTGSKTFTVKIAHTLGSALKDIEVFLEVEALTTSTNTPLVERNITRPVLSGTRIPDVQDTTGSSLTNSSELWTGITGEITHDLAKTLTVNEIGWARARVGLTLNNTTIYVNPTLIVT